MNDARCARHPDSVASFTCPRCGTFSCVECERRATPDSPPICPACWAKLPNATQTAGGTGLQTAGLILGIASVIPCCPLALVSTVVNVIAIIQAKNPPARDVRWKPILGLCLSLGFMVLQVLFYAFFQVFSKR